MDAEKFKILSEELETISGLLPAYSESAGGFYSKEYIIICDEDGIGSPIFTNYNICFNGDAKKGNDHEAFSISQNNTKHAKFYGSSNGYISDFVKTSRKPYDLMVKISMLRIKHHFPKCEIKCDGDKEDWKQAKEIYKKVFRGKIPKVD